VSTQFHSKTPTYHHHSGLENNRRRPHILQLPEKKPPLSIAPRSNWHQTAHAQTQKDEYDLHSLQRQKIPLVPDKLYTENHGPGEVHKVEEGHNAQHRAGNVILDLVAEQIAAAVGASERIVGPIVLEIVAAAEALADEEALFVLVEDQKGVEHEEALAEAVARVGVLHEELVDEARTAAEGTAEEAADIAVWEDILEPNMNTDPWLLEHTAFVQKHKKLT
jgi:hypothetical protein